MSSSGVARTVSELCQSIGEMGRVAVLLAKVVDPRVTVPLLRSVLEVASPDRPLGQLIAKEGGLDRALAPGGMIDSLLAADGALNQLVGERGLIERILAEGGTLDQISGLGNTLESVAPMLSDLGPGIQAIADSAAKLSAAAEPLGDLAGWFPARKKRGSRGVIEIDDLGSAADMYR